MSQESVGSPRRAVVEPRAQAEVDALARRVRRALSGILHPEDSFDLTAIVRRGTISIKALSFRPNEEEQRTR